MGNIHLNVLTESKKILFADGLINLTDVVDK